MKKIGRNSPCWCMSGIKYKKCHLNRDKQSPPNEWDLIKQHKKEFSQKYCLCPKEHPIPCNGKIINAHTVSKSNSLKVIARDKHVYSFLVPIEKHLKFRRSNTIITPELQGINIALTFTGFCKEHDRVLFYDIDDKDFTVNKKQIFLFLYRTISREIFGKLAQTNSINLLKDCDKGLDFDNQLLHQSKVNSMGFGTELANNDLAFQKNILDQILIKETYDGVEGFIIKCQKIPTLLCSGSIFPHYDFKGSMIQNLGDFSIRLRSIAINIIPSNNKGYIIFSWIKEDRDICLRFIESLTSLDKTRITDAIIRFLFEHIENRFANPDWWDSLPTDKQKKLNFKFDQSIRLNVDINPNSLVEDNIHYDDWVIESLDYV